MKVKREILRSKVTGDIYKIREYDERGNLTYFKDNFNGKGYEEWRTYDQNNNLICSIDSNGTEIVNLYSDNGVKIREDIYEYEFYPEEVKVEESEEVKVEESEEKEIPTEEVKDQKSWIANIAESIHENMNILQPIALGVGAVVGSVLGVIFGLLF